MKNKEDLIKHLDQWITDAQRLRDSMLEWDEPTARTPKDRKWSTIKGAPKGIFFSSMTGHVNNRGTRVAIMLTRNLDFRVVQDGHPLENHVFDSPSKMVAEVMGVRSINGYDHVTLDGHPLADLRDRWLEE